MAQSRASYDEFFTKLGSLIESTQRKGHGSVFLTQKRLHHDLSNEPAPPTDSLDQSNPQPVIVRVSDGDTQSSDRKKNKDHVKFSTIVQAGDLDSFFARYADVCKTGMQSLKKRDRSKRSRKKKKTVETKT